MKLNFRHIVMIRYRITKFDPKKRNHKGHFLDNSEWTAISDIGKPAYNYVSYEAYETIETAYVEAVLLILKEKQIHSLEVASLENFYDIEEFEQDKSSGRLKNMEVDYYKDIAILQNGLKLGLEDLPKIIRLILRECLWLELVSLHFKLSFGYDYYMYVECFKLQKNTIKVIENQRLFVEDMT